VSGLLATESRTLQSLSEREREERFDTLQRQLPAVWAAMRLNLIGESIVVVPSVSLDRVVDRRTPVQAYEERFLFLLLLLRQPRLQVIYVTSTEIDPTIIEYYLALLTGVIPSHARARLHLVAAHDASPAPLTSKVLDRPRMIERIRALIPDPRLSHLVAYNVTRLERDLALVLGIPLFGADPRHLPLGTKSGCRRLFAEEGVPHPLGYEEIDGLEALLAALTRLRAQRPQVGQAIVKLNEGVSGIGNAIVDLRDLPAPGSAGERPELESRVRAMAFEFAEMPFEQYFAKLEERHGVVEERIGGMELRSPSVQLRVIPDGTVELLSTHDQLLGGPSGQSYLGCRFPADYMYAKAITREAAKVGARLSREGVIGRFAVDFVVVRDRDEGWTPYAIELNLRKGGTTHPFLTLQFLTGGSYDPETALFVAPNGREKHLVATDHLSSPLFRGLTHADLFDIVARHGLQFDQSRQAGVVFHMMTALSEFGIVGMTAVGDSAREADETYRRAERILLEEASEAMIEPIVPVHVGGN
jgi:PGM1 C-terminal domain